MREGDRKTAKKTGTAKKTKTGPSRNLHRELKRKTGSRVRPQTEYSVYEFSMGERMKYLAIYILLDGCVSYLFFRSVIAFVLLFPGVFLFFREQKKSLLKRRKKELTGQFLDGIQLMLAALMAGYSPENALREAQKELVKIYDADEMIVREFRRMDAQLRMSRNLEEVMLDFGRRSGVSDILSFAEVFLTAKRTGGDLIAVIRNTISCIRQKQETMQEIETCLAGKLMEQNIMSVIPLLILAYVKFSSPDFLDVMYETTEGMTVMILCFGVYLLAWFWGQSIVRIEV
ncbi:MAG: type II secretion system F family protein [Lachnospiraceae bacterium]|nr:type II secretion system F family protein [Lachnospiraceae bacterium]